MAREQREMSHLDALKQACLFLRRQGISSARLPGVGSWGGQGATVAGSDDQEIAR